MPAQDVSGEDAELAINSFTNRLLAWLHDQGYRIQPVREGR
jgi:hypothetical protein